jgi:hypothetical protein
VNIADLAVEERKAQITLAGITPRFQHSIDLIANRSAGLVAIVASHQKLIVPGVTVSNARNHSEGQRFFFQRPARSRAPDSSAAPPCRVLRYGSGFCGRATGEQPRYLPRHVGDKILILLGAPLRIPFATQRTQLTVREAFLFSLIESSFGNQNTLPFVSLARPTETDNHGPKRAALPGSARQRGISARKINEFIEVGAIHAESARSLLEQKVPLAKLLVAFGTSRLAEDGEDQQVSGFSRRHNRVFLLFIYIHTRAPVAPDILLPDF